MSNSIDIQIEGTEDELSAIFSYSKELNDSGLTTLTTYMCHFFNQTLLRDNFNGAWAQVWKIKETGKFNLKMCSPHHDLTIYQKLIPAFLEAGKLALEIKNNIQDNIDEVIKATGKKMIFKLPFGLSMANAKSIQLLHFPPIEAFVYMDYIFSPTNRHWENLLGYNNFDHFQFAELESIVDCVPLAAPGADNTGINPFNFSFTPYVKKMLQARLIPAGQTTQSVIACGGPVHEWLENAFPDQIQTDLKTLSLIELNILDNGVKTPVLCANHPSQYLYFVGKEYTPEKKEVLIQDLIATGWQAKMAYGTDMSPGELLSSLQAYWNSSPQVMKIMEQMDLEFNYKY